MAPKKEGNPVWVKCCMCQKVVKLSTIKNHLRDTDKFRETIRVDCIFCKCDKSLGSLDEHLKTCQQSPFNPQSGITATKTKYVYLLVKRGDGDFELGEAPETLKLIPGDSRKEVTDTSQRLTMDSQRKKERARLTKPKVGLPGVRLHLHCQMLGIKLDAAITDILVPQGLLDNFFTDWEADDDYLCGHLDIEPTDLSRPPECQVKACGKLADKMLRCGHRTCLLCSFLRACPVCRSRIKSAYTLEYSVQAEPDLPQGADLSAQLLPPTSGAAILAVSPGGTITPAEDLEPKARLPVNRETAQRLVKSRIGSRPLLRTMLNHLKCTFEASSSLEGLQELLADYLVRHMAKASQLSETLYALAACQGCTERDAIQMALKCRHLLCEACGTNNKCTIDGSAIIDTVILKD